MEISPRRHDAQEGLKPARKPTAPQKINSYQIGKRMMSPSGKSFACLALSLLALQLVGAADSTSDSDQQARHLFILSGQSNMTAGLEKGFTEVVTKALGAEQVTIVRHCKPGRGIRFWVEDYELPEDHPLHGKLKSGNGAQFPVLLELAKTAGDANTYDSVNFVWMQGESDAQRDLGAAYARSFNTLLSRLKAGLGIEAMHVVIARLSDHGLHTDKKESWARMRMVQMELAEADPLTCWVDTDDLNGSTEKHPQGELHYPREQYPKLGARLAKAALRQLAPSK
jgi:hypothetical protein